MSVRTLEDAEADLSAARTRIAELESEGAKYAKVVGQMQSEIDRLHEQLTEARRYKHDGDRY